MTGRTVLPGAVLWLLPDNQGTIRDVAQYNSGTGVTSIVDHLKYDSFGNITAQSNSAYQPLFAYTGMQWDSAAGLYYDHARWYDPHLGRFISQDPTSFAAGDVNLYRYVGNGPGNGVDPTGRDAAPIGTNVPAFAFVPPASAPPRSVDIGPGYTPCEEPGFLSGYLRFLLNPSQMDRDLRYTFYGAVTVAGVAGVAAGGLAVAAPGLGGTAICGGGTAAGAGATAGAGTGAAATGGSVSAAAAGGGTLGGWAAGGCAGLPTAGAAGGAGAAGAAAAGGAAAGAAAGGSGSVGAAAAAAAALLQRRLDVLNRLISNMQQEMIRQQAKIDSIWNQVNGYGKNRVDKSEALLQQMAEELAKMEAERQAILRELGR